ncbi:MAG: T9SS type A sorting domain-containing protein [Bacteroidales bacterium]|nr:T9SS type A sorting domain-containing protein [Bacteroidales bacterium]
MSNRFLNLVVSCILLLVSTVSALGQTILVEKQDGTKYDELIADVRNLHFQSDDLILLLKDGTMNAIALDEIKKIYFDMSTGFIEKSASGFILSPNPVNDLLRIDGISTTEEILYIYRIDGTLVFSQQINKSDSMILELAHLYPGLYFIRIAGLTSKFIKL